MLSEKRNTSGRWAGLAIAATLLALCLVLLAGRTLAQNSGLVMSVNYGHDWVEGSYEAGHTISISVTQGDGSTVKATADVQTQQIPWWEPGQIGFSTDIDDPWDPARPDIKAGDWAYGRSDEGYTSTIHIGRIDVEVDVDDDTVSGHIYADWFTETLKASCSVWEENGPYQPFDVEPDGGAYSCDFGALGWDLLPGHTVAVSYKEPDGDQVFNALDVPAPNLHLEKWVEGNNEASPGGPLVFTLRYRNEGDAATGAIVLTDTVPTNTYYLADGSGVAPTISVDKIVWTLGPLDPEEEVRFNLVLTNTASASDTLHNEADIYTLYDDDDGNNHAEAEIHVSDGPPDLYVNKNRAADDPVPGQTILYEIDYGNQEPVASGPVIMTDTLPADTTVVSWFSENGYNVWTEVSRDGQLVLEAPTIPGYWGDRIMLRLRLDAGADPDTPLRNRVDIATKDDMDTDNNWSERKDWIGSPRRDVGVEKRLNWGEMVAGGRMEYGVHFRNDGNMATQVRLTDTLPVSTTLQGAWRSTAWTNLSFPPDFQDDGVIAWDIGLLEPGESYDLNIRLAIDEDALPNTVLTNCATVAIDGVDAQPFNNTECAVDGIRKPGPNLRVWKEYWWEGQDRLRFDVQIENLGTRELQDVEITDIYPDDTAFNGDWWVNHGPGITMQHTPADRELVFVADHFWPGETASIGFRVDLDGSVVGKQGLLFTNRVEAPITGDVYPADNVHEVSAGTGPDLYVRKWLSDGELRAGEMLTIAVQCGNENQDPWRMSDDTIARLIDRLPEGMSYVAAFWPDGQPNEPWFGELEVPVVIWNMGHFGNQDHRFFYLVVKLDEDLPPATKLRNQIEIVGVPDVDTDPNPGNNTFVYDVTLEGMRVYLPMILKGYAGGAR